MVIKDIIQLLNSVAPPAYQESYDNCGLITGNSAALCTGIICSLDCTEAVVQEAINKQCNLIVSHHPIVFKGLTKLTGSNYVEQTIIKAIKNDIAIFAIHTNLDNMWHGVNNIIAQKLGLNNLKILSNKQQVLSKLQVFVPVHHKVNVQNALFAAGAGEIGNYIECSFNTQGVGTFKANDRANPFVGVANNQHLEPETKVEVIFPTYLQPAVINALRLSHPYEEPAYDIISLQNHHRYVGSGMVGEWEDEITEEQFLQLVSETFGVKAFQHTHLLGKNIKTVALCGGSGSFLIRKAIAAQADAYITADIKYHEFFDAEGKILVANIGHWETEQFTPELLVSIIKEKFPNFAVQKSEVNTNPIHIFVG